MKKMLIVLLIIITTFILGGCREKVKWWVNGIGIGRSYTVLDFQSGYDVIEIPNEYKGHPIVNINQGLTIHVPDETKKVILGKNIEETGAIIGKNLEEIVVSEENQYYLSIDGVLYNKELTKLISYPNNKQAKLFVILETIENIRSFSNNNLEELWIYCDKIEFDYTNIINSNSVKNIKRIYIKEINYDSLKEYIERYNLEIELYIIEE